MGLEGFMGDKVEWRIHAIIGILMVGVTFTDVSPAGPWNDPTFTSGTIGLVGLILLYMAWFRLTFNQTGLVPVVDKWHDPQKSSIRVMVTGLVLMGLAFGVGRIEFFPAPAGLIVSLVGLLVLLNGVYVWMISAGPLSEEEE